VTGGQTDVQTYDGSIYRASKASRGKKNYRCKNIFKKRTIPVRDNTAATVTGKNLQFPPDGAMHRYPPTIIIIIIIIIEIVLKVHK